MFLVKMEVNVAFIASELLRKKLKKIGVKETCFLHTLPSLSSV